MLSAISVGLITIVGGGIVIGASVIQNNEIAAEESRLEAMKVQEAQDLVDAEVRASEMTKEVVLFMDSASSYMTIAQSERLRLLRNALDRRRTGEEACSGMTKAECISDLVDFLRKYIDAIGPEDSPAQVAARQLEKDRTDAQAQAQADADAAAAAKAAAEAADAAARAREFGDGSFVVGLDIPEGTYRTINTSIRECYWERSTGSGEIIENDFVTFAPEGVSVTVFNGEGFTVHGCGRWGPI